MGNEWGVVGVWCRREAATAEELKKSQEERDKLEAALAEMKAAHVKMLAEQAAKYHADVAAWKQLEIDVEEERGWHRAELQALNKMIADQKAEYDEMLEAEKESHETMLNQERKRHQSEASRYSTPRDTISNLTWRQVHEYAVPCECAAILRAQQHKHR